MNFKIVGEFIMATPTENIKRKKYSRIDRGRSVLTLWPSCLSLLGRSKGGGDRPVKRCSVSSLPLSLLRICGSGSRIDLRFS